MISKTFFSLVLFLPIVAPKSDSSPLLPAEVYNTSNRYQENDLEVKNVVKLNKEEILYLDEFKDANNCLDLSHEEKNNSKSEDKLEFPKTLATNNSEENGNLYANISSKKENPYPDALETLFNIGVRLQNVLGETDANEKNFIVSPLGMVIIIGQLCIGARGNLQHFLADLLNIDYEQEESHENDTVPFLNFHKQFEHLLADLEKQNGFYILEIDSALFLQEDLQLTSVFNESIDNFYHTHITPVNFQSEPVATFNKINNWASDHTHGRINQILPQPLPPTSGAVLANTVYLKADWETPFNTELTTKSTFYVSPNKTVDVDFLRGFLKLPFAESKVLNCKMTVLPYKNDKMAMYLILPNADDWREFNIKNFTTHLQLKDINQLIGELKMSKVRLILPKINLSSKINVLDSLNKYMKYEKHSKKFDDSKIENKQSKMVEEMDSVNQFNLNGASPDPRFQLNDIVQQISLAINEMGTEAAATSTSTHDLQSGYKDFFATRPFLFFIREETTKATIFSGNIVNPSG